MGQGSQVPNAGPSKQPTQQQDALVEIAGIWGYTSKSGDWYGRGAVGNAVYLIIPNKRKKNDKEPDYKLCVSRRPPKKDGDKKPTGPAGSLPPSPPEEPRAQDELVDPDTGEIL